MGDDQAEKISRRKLEHLELALNGHVAGPAGPGWDDVRLIHDALPDLNIDDIDLSTPFLAVTLHAPLWISGMTGGHDRASVINARLARAAERFGLAMGLGSQRAALAAESLTASYQSAREAAPNAVLLANIGVPQLVPQNGSLALQVEDLERIVCSIRADGLAIHLNWLQEVVQPEGDREARGCLAAIRHVAGRLSVPVIAKETGAGISRERARDLAAAGVRAIDVGGAGGTSMVRIEQARAHDRGDTSAALAETFDGWGIPTAASVLEARDCGVPVIATGGVRTGLDAARALALGAHMVGVGLPFLKAADAGEDALTAAIERFLRELRSALFLTGSRTPEALRSRPFVIFGELEGWARQRRLL